MLTEGAKKWVEALRSGEFPQGRLRLGNEKMGYCCLGVACQVAIREGILDERYYNPNGADLSHYPEVMEWLGLKSPSGTFNDPHGVTSLANINDGPARRDSAPFNEIADIIESEPHKLFRRP